MTADAGTGSSSSSAKDVILGRIRRALAESGQAEAANGEPESIPRDYLRAHVTDGLVDLLAENLADYRARVHRCAPEEVSATIARLLAENGDGSVVVPEGLPEEWLSAARSTQDSALAVVADSADETGELTARSLDSVDAVLSGCALAIAETGTIVLDGGAGQGRRMLTLVPDHHVCVVRCPEQVVASVPLALPQLDPTRPQTWIAGPSATSDIELDRVEGVHGPRLLDVILVEAPAGAG